MTDELIQIPHSPAAEDSVLGSLLINPEALQRLQLSADDFYLHHNRMIFEAMRGLYSRGQAVDYTTLCSELSQRGQLAEVGGPAYMMKITNDTISAMHLESYADIVRKLARRRMVIGQAENLLTSAYDQDSDLNAAIGAIMDKLARLNSIHGGAVHISEVISEVYDEVERATNNPQEIYGIPTGFPDWDKLTYGLQPGTVVKITGEPGIGKSLLAVQVLAQAAGAGHPGALYELEMRRQNVVRRLLSAQSKIPTYKMQQGKIDDDEWECFAQSVETLAALPVYIEASSQLTTGDIRADLYRLKQQYGVELAVVDYESLLQDTQAGTNENGLSAIRSSRLHGIAMDLDICIIALDDMVKSGVTGEREGQAVVSGSGKKLHDADEIIVMRRAKDNSRLVTLTWEKNREGQAKRFVQLWQQAAYPAFNSYDNGRKLP